MANLKRRLHSDEFKHEVVKLVTDHGYSVAEAARNPGLHANLLRTWKKKSETEAIDSELSEEERMEMASLRAENKRLRMEHDILKKRRPSSQKSERFAASRRSCVRHSRSTTGKSSPVMND
jgi:transposase